jgi:hypothetical protein
MERLLQSLAEKWDFYLAMVLLYVVIGIYFGPVWFFLGLFCSGCFGIIAYALRRPPAI